MVERVGTCNPVAIDVTRVWVPIFWSASRGGRNARLSTALLRNDSYAFDAENERLVVVSAAHGRVHVFGPPAEVRDVLELPRRNWPAVWHCIRLTCSVENASGAVPCVRTRDERIHSTGNNNRYPSVINIQSHVSANGKTYIYVQKILGRHVLSEITLNPPTITSLRQPCCKPTTSCLAHCS